MEKKVETENQQFPMGLIENLGKVCEDNKINEPVLQLMLVQDQNTLQEIQKNPTLQLDPILVLQKQGSQLVCKFNDYLKRPQSDSGNQADKILLTKLFCLLMANFMRRQAYYAQASYKKIKEGVEIVKAGIACFQEALRQMNNVITDQEQDSLSKRWNDIRDLQ